MCFNYFLFIHDANSATVKNAHRKLCLGIHPDKNSYTRASIDMVIINQARIYIADYFYCIYIKDIEIHNYDYNIDMEEKHKRYVSRYKCKRKN